MSFIQKLFTSRDNQTANVDDQTGNLSTTYVGQQDRIWWNPDINALYYSDGNTPGGIPIGTASGTGIPLGPLNSVQLNNGGGNFAGSSNLVFSNNVLSVVGNISATGNVTASYFLGNVSTTGNIVGGNILSNSYLYANGNSIFANVAFTGNIDLGNLYIIDETIYGKNTDQDIVLTPRGTGYVSVPKLKIPVGTVLENTAVVVPIISSLILSSVLDYSTGPSDTLPSGTYGIPGGVTAPWTAYQFTTVPTPALEPQDIVSGAGVPADSRVVYVGTGSGNTNIVVTTQTYQDLPTPVPTPGTTMNVSRALTKAGLSISTLANTDIGLNPGSGGNTIIAGSLLPLTDNQFTVGSPARRIKSMYLGGGTIYIFDDVLGVDQAISASNGNLVVQGGTGINVGEFTLFANTIAIANSAANINIGVGSATGTVVFNRPIAVNANVAYPYPTFTVSRAGLVDINIASLLPADQAALNINGAASGNTYPRNFSGTLLQLTNLDREPARFSGDAFGANVSTGQNAYFAIASRVARGNVDAPSQTQANDLMMRVTSQGFNNAGAFQGSIVRYNQIARENFTTTAAGTRHNFAATPVGSVTIKNIANIDAQGITLSSVATGGPANTGITFQDGSYQNTAWVPSNNVNSLTAGAGISLSASTGNITIGSTGVLGVNGTTNQINVANVGNVLTLSLPQNFNTTANVQLYSLTVNDLTILGNVSNVIPSVVGGKIVYVANKATDLAGINTSGLVTGNAANGYYAGILYNTSSNTWDLGIGNSKGITSGNIYTDNIIANVGIHLGNAYNNYDFPEALVQGDTRVDSYTQIVLKNHYQGANASADFVAVSNNGDDTVNYIDFGINSNVYSNADYAVTGYNDGYLYTNGGDLAIGTQTAGKVINLFTGGTNDVNNIRAVVSDGSLTMKNANVLVQDGYDNSVIELNTNGNIVFNGSQTLRVNSGFYVSSVNTNNGDANIVNYTGGQFVYGPALKDYAGNLKANNFTATGNITGGNIRTAGVVTATGNITGNYFIGNGSQLTGLPAAYGNANVVANLAALGSNPVSTTGNITGGYIFGNGSQLTGLPAAYGNANVVANLAALGSNPVSTTGNITAGYILGNGSQLTGVIHTLGNAFTTISSNGVSITAANSTSTATLTPGNNITIAGNSSTNITVFSVVDAPVFTGNVTGGNIRTTGLISATGNVTGNYFIGNGSQLTGIVGSYGNANVVANLAALGSNPVSTTGNVTAGYFIGNGSQLTGIFNATSNISTTGNVTGNYVIASGGNTVINSGVSTTGNVTGANLITGGLITATGNITGGNIRTTGVISATGNITGNYFIGNGSQLTGVITTITPTALSSTVHVAAVTTGTTANIISDATTANTANTLVLRDANGAISVNGWTVGTHLTAVDYTATNSDYWIGTTAKNKTITLPNAANGAVTGRQYQIADAVHSGNPGTTIAAQSPATVVGNQPSQQSQIIIATYIGGVWYCN
jgi:hypothetical protein